MENEEARLGSHLNFFPRTDSNGWQGLAIDNLSSCKVPASPDLIEAHLGRRRMSSLHPTNSCLASVFHVTVQPHLKP